jgi:hypothetical protein
MIRCIGRIELHRELSFTEAQKLQQLFSIEHNFRPYEKMCLEVASDGRAIQWNRDEKIEHIEVMLADALIFLKKWNVKATGVVKILQEQKKKFEVIVIADKVKLYKDGNIQNVIPSPIS